MHNYRYLTKTITILLISLITITGNSLFAQEEQDEKEQGFIFTTVKKLPATGIKNQARTGTCWSFATVSFLESEAMRLGKDSLDLSEMFMVRHVYPPKARHYVRFHGMASFGSGSLAHDAMRVFRDYGAVPESVYSGKFVGQSKHNHGEMDAVLKGVLDAVIKNRGRKLSNVWLNAVNAILDTYLGKIPEKFNYNGKTYTPKSFAKEIGINPDDYLELSSFTHHPFYAQFMLEVPDNWSAGQCYNLPLDDLMAVIDNAIDNGYSIAWDGDTSEKGFNAKEGVAILPLKEWDDRTKAEKDTLCKAPEPEKVVTQEYRQETFDNYKSTDDHLMHIIGITKDQNDTRYYITKNSWGTKEKGNGGFINMSESYVRAKTISILVHRDAVPKRIGKKLRLQ